MKSYQKGFRRFIVYTLVGCFDTAMDWCAFTLMHAVFLATPAASQVVGYLVGCGCCFLIQGSLTFGDGGGCDWDKLLRFALWNLVSLTITTVLITVLTRAGMWAYLAKLFVTMEEGIANYFAYKYLVFHVKRSDRRDRA